MNLKVVNAVPNSKSDKIKWVLIAALLLAAVVVSTRFADVPAVYQIIGWLLVSFIVVSAALQTNKGRITWKFLQEARIELRKVVWPTRQETTQTTLVVLVMVIVTALFLWGIDSLLLWIVSFLTGARG